MSVHDVLVAARDMIAKEDDWCQGSRLNNSGQRCALGAIDFATNRNYYSDSAEYLEAVEALAERIDKEALDPDPYNGGGYRATEKMKLAQWTLNEAAVANHNNTNPHSCVIELFDGAIEATKP